MKRKEKKVDRKRKERKERKEDRNRKEKKGEERSRVVWRLDDIRG